MSEVLPRNSMHFINLNDTRANCMIISRLGLHDFFMNNFYPINREFFSALHPPPVRITMFFSSTIQRFHFERKIRNSQKSWIYKNWYFISQLKPKTILQIFDSNLRFSDAKSLMVASEDTKPPKWLLNICLNRFKNVWNHQNKINYIRESRTVLIKITSWLVIYCELRFLVRTGWLS